MDTILFLSRFIALGVKTKGSPSNFGEGHNFTVNAGFCVQGQVDETLLNASLDRVLARIDHRALGVDLDLGFDPVPSALVQWVFNELQGETKGETSVCEVQMVRGDGVRADYFKQP